MFDVENFISAIKVKLLQTHTWYGHVLVQLPVIYGDEVPTFGVGKTSKDEVQVKLYINPDYIQSVIAQVNRNEEKVVDHFIEVMRHEIHHLVFAHLTLDFQDKSRQMIACELSANSYIKRNNLIPAVGEKKAGVFAEDYKLESGLGVHEYYRLLENNKEYKKMLSEIQKQIQVVIGKGGCGAGGSSGSEIIKDGKLDSHDKWESLVGDDFTKEMVRDIVRQAHNTCEQMGRWGDLPADIKQAIDGAFRRDKNIIPWEVVLKNFLASSSENVLDYTMKRKSKRYGTRPGTKKEDVLDIAIGIDTSGSISDDMLKLFFSEMEWMVKSNSRLTVFEWDTKVNREYDFRDFDGTVMGRGGTDPIPALDEISERRFDCLIMFTDFGFDTIKKEYNIPILWVVDYNYLWSDKIPVSTGTVLKLNKDKDGFEQIFY